jgi:hypothetical protein
MTGLNDEQLTDLGAYSQGMFSKVAAMDRPRSET